MRLVLSETRPRLDAAPRRLRRGVYLLPSLLTMGNLFCGYACIVYAMRGDYATAAPFVGIAALLDALDGRIARLTGTSSEFGLQFDSLADVISFGMAPAVLTFSWGLTSLGRWGWAAGFIYVAAAAMRLARFNIQTGSVDKRYFVGMPSPAAATVPAATIYAYPAGLSAPIGEVLALALVLVPGFLMVSTFRFRSFKTIDFQTRRSVHGAHRDRVGHRRDFRAPGADAGRDLVRVSDVGVRRVGRQSRPPPGHGAGGPEPGARSKARLVTRSGRPMPGTPS